MRAAGPPGVVFADVDGTLIRGSSLIDLLLFDAGTRDAVDAAEALVRSVRQAAASGVPRSRTAPLLYSWWADRPVAEVLDVAEQWVRSGLRSDRTRFVHRAVDDEITARRGAGTALVLVSASFDAPLAALAEVFDATDVLCTPMVVVDGRYTGASGTPMLGEHKARAVRGYLADAPPGHSTAYGDHPTDLEMLAAVDEAVVVTDRTHGPLVVEAAARGWRVITVPP
ncbi:HAD family hydrolase [Saccharothrix texasensis]|uniref:HAD superfamily hydrolase (TIGR01490 family) n=1 Tax=Saccharothrix texasensis TaxID=103734 RepID=A0A3N1HH40_9PSEU|nr:HAD-IB family phosphatase [Saccharothrix texasensis]ROP41817.1 HAD superfamily hydrolase (TIGR01490 family) [Saccharothrix texasensis]